MTFCDEYAKLRLAQIFGQQSKADIEKIQISNLFLKVVLCKCNLKSELLQTRVLIFGLAKSMMNGINLDKATI